MAQPHVLVVDDYDDAREMYAEYLVLSGFRVSEACTGQQALDLAAEELPHVIVMDLSLPVLDGLEATRRLKAGATTRHIPVLAMTGHAGTEHSRRALAAGCSAYVVKPCMPDDLVRELQRLLAA